MSIYPLVSLLLRDLFERLGLLNHFLAEDLGPLGGQSEPTDGAAELDQYHTIDWILYDAIPDPSARARIACFSAWDR